MWPRSQSGEQLTSPSRSVISRSISCPLFLLPISQPRALSEAAFCPQPVLLICCLFAQSLPISGCCLLPGWKRNCWGIIFEPRSSAGSPGRGPGFACAAATAVTSHLPARPSPPSLPTAHSSPNLRPAFPFLLPFPAGLGMSSKPPQLQLDFRRHVPRRGSPASLPAHWADPCWESGRSFPHLSSSGALVGAPNAERGSKWRQDLRECSSGSGRMLQAVGHSLQRVGARCQHQQFWLWLWLFLPFSAVPATPPGCWGQE